MKEIQIKKHILYVFAIAISIFMINKFYVRPWILNMELPELFHIIVLSLPNLVEAIVGSLILTGILLQTRLYFTERIGHIQDIYIYLAAVAITGAYTISQEFKLHNIGGNNVFDVYDVAASIIGLIVAFVTIQKFGFIKNSSL